MKLKLIVLSVVMASGISGMDIGTARLDLRRTALERQLDDIAEQRNNLLPDLQEWLNIERKLAHYNATHGTQFDVEDREALARDADDGSRSAPLDELDVRFLRNWQWQPDALINQVNRLNDEADALVNQLNQLVAEYGRARMLSSVKGLR